MILYTEGDRFARFTAAAVQAASVALDRDQTIDKLESLTAEAARNGADVVVFSESFVPGFPVWNLVLAPVDQHDLFKALVHNSLTLPGPHVERLGGIARRHEVLLSVGVTERSTVSLGCLWNTNLLFDRQGRLINHRRKLVPTWAEKLTWASGDAHDLTPAETDCGRLGVLICGENTNTLARYTLLAEGEQVHVATYPPAWPSRRPTSGSGYDLARAVEIRSAAHAFEGKVFSIVASGVLDQDSIKLVEAIDPAAAEILRAAPRPASLIVGPEGTAVSEPLVGEEGIVYADIDVAAAIEPKQFHDIVGYYQRFDLFEVSVDHRRQRPITVRSGGGAPATEGHDEPRDADGPRATDPPSPVDAGDE
jgi:nitrilase